MEERSNVVWITGASSGIGAATALEFAKQGYNLVLSARRVAALEAVKADCEKHGVQAWVVPLDLAATSEVENLVTEVISKVGNIDILFNNGGISQRALAKESPLEVDRRIMEINYFGTIALTKAVLPYMIKNGGGHIAVTSSLVGKFGFPLRSAYAASKHALHGFFESLRAECKDDNIRVTIICPGRIRTPISESALTKDGKQWGKSDAGQAKGMPADVCARKIFKAIKRNKKEVVIGNSEVLMIYIKRFFPFLYHWLVLRIKPT